MTTRPNVENRGLTEFVSLTQSFDRLLHHTLLISLLLLAGLLGLSTNPVLAAPAAMSDRIASQVVKPAAESDRTTAFLACLPEELSRPSLKRAISEMGNDQIERILSLKANPKLSQAETELKECLNRKGFTN